MRGRLPKNADVFGSGELDRELRRQMAKGSRRPVLTIEIVRAERLKSRLERAAIKELADEARQRGRDVRPPSIKAIAVKVIETASAASGLKFDPKRIDAYLRWRQKPHASNFGAILSPQQKKRRSKALEPVSYAGKQR